MDSVSKLYGELIPFSDLYDSASFEAKKMIVNFENGVKSKIGGYIGTACKSLKTVQAKQCSPQKSASAKRKAPYFLRSMVLFWWRIPGSNR